MQDSVLVRLSDKQRQRIQTRHKVAVERFGYQPQALYWSNREVQEIRFKQLMSILPSKNSLKHQAWSLLDVGCGFADLSDYLAREGYFPVYTGLDVSSDMVLGAQSMHPEHTILNGEIADFKFSKCQFNYVMLSGSLNEVVETEIEGTAKLQGNYAKAVIREMYRICQKGVAFNLLDKRNSWVHSRFDLQSFLPEDIVEFCKTFANEVSLIEDYLENDFTIYLHKTL